MTRTQAAKIKRYEGRMAVNVRLMLESIRHGNVSLSGAAAEMAAHYARSIQAARTVAG